MIPEIGIMSLCLALILTGLQTFFPLIGHRTQQTQWFELTQLAVVMQFVMLLIAFACLAISFLENDFTVIYIIKQSSLSLPWYYKLAAVWGGHEGSLLLWMLVVTGWSVLLSLFAKSIPLAFKASVLGILGFMNIGFYLFLLTTSQPFARQFNRVPLDGNDLNPILQDPGLLFHPPMLYMGYVGFAITFAFAIAGLIHRSINKDWARWCRPWVMLSWSSLTLGIVLGSWWAYHVLGWGGWWFWDPVENASLLPWLAATALIHSLIVTLKHEQLIAWSILLAILTYSLSLLGTFLVRSGVLISVHAFAADSTRGLFLLCYLLTMVTGAVLLFSWRLPQLQSVSNIPVVSRRAMLLYSSVLLLTIMGTVLLGTLYPLILDVLHLGKISVGLPYFNRVIVPFSFLLFILMGIGIHCHWQDTSWNAVLRRLSHPIGLSALMSTGICLILPTSDSWLVYVGILLGCWVITSTSMKFFSFAKKRSKLSLLFAHSGIGIIAIAISITSHYSESQECIMKVGDTVKLANYSITLEQLNTARGDNYRALEGIFRLPNQEKIVPQRRLYEVTQQLISEAGIRVRLFSDIYIVMGEVLDDAVTVRMMYKPMVRWIWLGGILILISGLVFLFQTPMIKRQMELSHDAP